MRTDLLLGLASEKHSERGLTSELRKHSAFVAERKSSAAAGAAGALNLEQTTRPRRLLQRLVLPSSN